MAALTVTAGDRVVVGVETINRGSVTDTQDIELVAQSTVQDAEPATLAPLGADTDLLVWDTTGVSAGTYTITVQSDDDQFTRDITVNAAATANFAVTVTSVAPSPATEGDAVDVTADIDNTGNAQGTQDITLDVAGTTEDTVAGVTLAAGNTATKTLTWQTSAGDAGSYSPTVSSNDDSDSQSVTVNQPASSSLTWETASDWDSAVSESGVVHESVANTDHSDASIVKQGYSAGSPYLGTDLAAYWPMHEVSGGAVKDLSGNNNDGTNGGATAVSNGLLVTGSFDFDGTDDNVDISSIHNEYSYSTFSYSFWVSIDSQGDNVFIHHGSASDERIEIVNNSSALGSGANKIGTNYEGGNDRDKIDDDISSWGSEWHFVVWTVDEPANTQKLYFDGSSVASGRTGSVSSPNSDALIGEWTNFGFEYDGKMADVRIYDTVLSSADIQTLYDVVDKQSSLTTATKSFSSAQKPDLQNLSYSLNGQSIDLDVIGSPSGTSETVTQSLGGATSYSLSWSNSHTDFRVKPKLSTSDPTQTPTISRVELA